MPVILITESLPDPKHCVVHQAHKSFANAEQTIRTTHCNIPGVSIRVSELTNVKGQMCKFVQVTYMNGPTKVQSDFTLTELFVLDAPDHL